MRRSGTWLIGSILAGLFCAPAPLPAQDQPREKLSRLQGRTSLDRRTRVIGVSVLVYNEDDPSRLFLTASDQDGVFRVDGLVDGDYLVHMSRLGFEPLVKTGVAVKFPFRAVVEVTMQPAAEASALVALSTPDDPSEPIALAGRVIELGSDPVGDVQLRFVRTDGSVDPHTVRTNPDGTFQIDPMRAGDWLLDAWGVGFLPMHKVLPLRGDTGLELILVAQPGDYEPTPLELIPLERAIPPPGLEGY
jgi:hypothetical protein